MITREGAMAVVLSADCQQVLLLRREIFLLWDLPGGGIEKNEDAAHAAVRETREETGYEIKIDQRVGCYLHQSVYGRGDQRTQVYRAHVVGGKARGFGLETFGLRWFPVNALPRGVQPLQRQMIVDALANASAPFERRIDFPRWKLYPARAAFFIARWLNLGVKIILGQGDEVTR